MQPTASRGSPTSDATCSDESEAVTAVVRRTPWKFSTVNRFVQTASEQTHRIAAATPKREVRPHWSQGPSGSPGRSPRGLCSVSSAPRRLRLVPRDPASPSSSAILTGHTPGSATLVRPHSKSAETPISQRSPRTSGSLSTLAQQQPPRGPSPRSCRRFPSHQGIASATPCSLGGGVHRSSARHRFRGPHCPKAPVRLRLCSAHFQFTPPRLPARAAPVTCGGLCPATPLLQAGAPQLARMQQSRIGPEASADPVLMWSNRPRPFQPAQRASMRPKPQQPSCGTGPQAAPPKRRLDMPGDRRRSDPEGPPHHRHRNPARERTSGMRRNPPK